MASKVKVLTTERDGIELQYREEANPFNDLLLSLGVLCNNEITVTGGSPVPSTVGFNAVIGSVYFCANGNIYKKTGNLDIDWTVLETGSSSILGKWKFNVSEFATVPAFYQSCIHGRAVLLEEGTTLALEEGADLILEQ